MLPHPRLGIDLIIPDFILYNIDNIGKQSELRLVF